MKRKATIRQFLPGSTGRQVGLLLLLVLAHTLNNVDILHRDTIPGLFDERAHFSTSMRWFGYLANRDHQNPELPKMYHFQELSSRYPPLAYLTAVPFYALFGPSLAAGVASMNLWLLVLVLSTYFLARRLCDHEIACLAAVMLTLVPMIYGHSRVFYLELPTAAMVTLTLALGCATSTKRSSWTLLALSLACLTKWTALIYIAPPLLFLWWKQAKDKKTFLFWRGWWLQVPLAGFVVVSGYLAFVDLPDVATYLDIFSNLPREGSPSSLVDGVTNYLSDSRQFLLRPVFFYSSAVLLLCYLILPGHREKAIVLSWILVPTTFFVFISGCGYFVNVRFLLPVVPGLVIGLSAALLRLRNTPFRMFRGGVSFLITVIIVVLLLDFALLSHAQSFTCRLIQETRWHHHYGRYRARAENWRGEDLCAFLSAQCHTWSTPAIIQPLFHYAHILSPLEHLVEMRLCPQLRMNQLLPQLAGGFVAAPTDSLAYDQLLREARFILDKDGPPRGMEDEQIGLPGVYRQFIEAKQRREHAFFVRATWSLPDGTSLILSEQTVPAATSANPTSMGN
ncbi:MAG: hypothetical protein A2284_12425 [Deltaproteobacteria bacterium RIFOXYA12_FULL_61_11]|nr:MAG: hypothetical protein A2284_12425 [Deltaproteobacteria bacterium RIFOXYA12_FULL_61_11]